MNSRRVRAGVEMTGDSGSLAEARRLHLQDTAPSPSARSSRPAVPRRVPVRDTAHGRGHELERVVVHGDRVGVHARAARRGGGPAGGAGGGGPLRSHGMPGFRPFDFSGLVAHPLADSQDFKVAGTADEVTALQLDVKRAVRGLPRRAPAARDDEVQAQDGGDQVRPQPPEGPDRAGGSVLRQLEDRFLVELDLTEEGRCLLYGETSSVERAKGVIQDLVCDVEPGEVYRGTIIEVKDFGLVVEILRNKEGLLHISEMKGKGAAGVKFVDVWTSCVPSTSLSDAINISREPSTLNPFSCANLRSSDTRIVLNLLPLLDFLSPLARATRKSVTKRGGMSPNDTFPATSTLSAQLRKSMQCSLRSARFRHISASIAVHDLVVHAHLQRRQHRRLAVTSAAAGLAPQLSGAGTLRAPAPSRPPAPLDPVNVQPPDQPAVRVVLPHQTALGGAHLPGSGTLGRRRGGDEPPGARVPGVRGLERAKEARLAHPLRLRLPPSAMSYERLSALPHPDVKFSLLPSLPPPTSNVSLTSGNFQVVHMGINSPLRQSDHVVRPSAWKPHLPRTS
ncbi:hypothetical protein THAOC_34988, partial [Thalassiosira oceanica]